MTERDRVLILGGGGFLGGALLPLAAERWTVDAPSSAELDVAAPGAVAAWLERRPASTVLNLAARQPGSAAAALTRVNGEGARRVAEAARDAGARLLHVSTDVVHDGLGAPYVDDAPARPVNGYGRSKAEGEAAVLAACPSALCVRTSLLWDPDVLDRATRGFAGRLERGEPCRLFTDEIRCPITRQRLAAALVELVELPIHGTLNVAGAEALSREAFGRALLAHFRIPGVERVEPVRAADLDWPDDERRPPDLTLDVDAASRMLTTPLHGVTAELTLARGREP